ncbi:hypothetical protein TSOC_006736, partial [Tetrabaena socialis]
PAILDTAADIAKALLHLHLNDVLHGDLKADNVMLKSSGGEGRGVIGKIPEPAVTALRSRLASDAAHPASSSSHTSGDNGSTASAPVGHAGSCNGSSGGSHTVGFALQQQQLQQQLLAEQPQQQQKRSSSSGRRRSRSRTKAEETEPS